MRARTESVTDLEFRAPDDLRIGSLAKLRIAAIGSCLLSGWPAVAAGLPDGPECDFFLIGATADVPQAYPNAAGYDCALVQLPLRFVMPDHTYFRLPYDNEAQYRDLFADCVGRLRDLLHATMRWNRERGLLTFVTNFLVPQQNPLGRLLPRYDLRNVAFFVESLNRQLAEIVAEYRNAYVLDFDGIVATFGKRYFQDDFVWQFNHASALSDADFAHDQDRMDGAFRAAETYPVRTGDVILAAWNEVIGMVRTLRQADQVKLVIVDLDDTLWRGVAAEFGEIAGESLEGWPLGVAEALGVLKRRGILLAISSRNDEEKIAAFWDRAFAGRLALDDFVLRKIDWRAKSEHVAEILEELNLLPSSALFVDDNPREREAVREAFPQMRVAGPNPLEWRRLLLWSPELQVAQIGRESAARTELVRGQLDRDAARKSIPRAEFLKNLEIAATAIAVDAPSHPSFARVLELINKTNQFNTTGRRWTHADLAAAVAADWRIFAFGARDRFVDYGVIGAIITRGAVIEQLVMSCRVAGLEMEIAMIAEVVRALALPAGRVTARFVPTASNAPSAGTYARAGFVASGDDWTLASDRIEPIEHIAMSELS